MFQFGGFNIFPDHGRPFNNSYKCYSVSMLPGNERHDVEKGGKIIMPPSALDQLTRLNVEYPMLFKLTNKTKNRLSHAGVLEFVADEGKIYLPYWMMHNLLLDEGEILKIESVSLPVATFSKFQPQSPEFLDITNPKAVLENALRNFACLTTGDVIAIKYNSKVFELCVLEVEPGNAVSIIECDMNVEFAPPIGYTEPEPVRRNVPAIDEANSDNFADNNDFVAFSGEGNRIDGKKNKAVDTKPSTVKKAYVRGVPNYDHVYGLITFDRTVRTAAKDGDDAANAAKFETFQGPGMSLKRGKKL